MKPKLSVTLGDLTPSWTTKRKLLATGLCCLSLATPGVASAAGKWVANRRYRDNLPDIGKSPC